LSKDNRRIIQGLAAQGHEIGLHYETDRYSGEHGRQHLLSDLRLLQDLSGHPIISASQHIPTDGDRLALVDYIEHEAYEPRFTEHPMTYISDSLMVWRQATPHDLLNSRASFQFLSHPDTWTSDYRSMDDALSDIMEQEIEAVRARYAELTRYYGRLLEERPKRDEHFKKRIAEPAKQLGHNADHCDTNTISATHRPR
jgi:hypothetical protein